jgi:hypothetical protein
MIRRARGGDTGKTSPLGKGPESEKGDQRRENPIHAGPARGGSNGTIARHRSRTGSDSDAGH